MLVAAIYVRHLRKIFYSRHIHDCNGEDGYYIDGGREYTKVIFDKPDGYVKLTLDGDVLLEQILHYDYLYKNRNAKEYPEGYYGTFEITKHSNPKFYNKLVVDGKEDILADIVFMKGDDENE